jgi:hypothetical protein
VSSELEKAWMEAGMAQVVVSFQNIDFLAESRTKDVPNARQKRYYLVDLPSVQRCPSVFIHMGEVAKEVLLSANILSLV